MSDHLRDRLQSSLGAAYTLERELGGGGMSRVFVAEDVALGRRIVVKVLAPELAEGLSAERFAREVRLAARLQHPNIVPVLSAGTGPDGLPHYTMPFVEGASLRERLAVGGALPVPEAVGVLRDVARALAYAHAHGVVHRDVKPENVLLTGGAAVVADFGIAKAISSSVTAREGLTAVGVALGTPAYMAPEQALADPAADHRVDLYALGVVAWELLAGRPPYADRPAQAQIAAHVAEAAPDVAAERADAPPALAALVMRLLAKSPDERPRSADDVLRLLDAVGTPAGTAAAPAPRARRRVRPRIAALAGILLAVLGVGAAWWRARGTPAAVSANAVAIAPFRVAGADPSLHYLREGMVDLLAAKIGGIGGLRAVDARTMLAAWRRAAGSGDADVVTADAIRVAARIGAGRLVLGEAVGSGRSVTVSATLLSAPDGREIVKASAVGAADSLPALVDRLAAQLLAQNAGEGRQRLDALTSTSHAALRAYLDGQALYRGGRATQAMQSFFRAVELDSTFTLAALALVRTVGWGGQSAADQARALSVGGRILHRGRARLSPVDAALADVALGPRYPAPVTYPEWLAAAERLAALAPESAESWFQVGDALHHGGGILGVTDADERALRAFDRALAIDSTYGPAWAHVATVYDDARDTTRLRQFVDRVRARASSDPGVAAVGASGVLRLAALTGDSAGVRAVRAALDTMPPARLRGLVLGALYHHHNLHEGRMAFDRLKAGAVTSEQRTLGALVALRLAIDGGRPGDVGRLVPPELRASPDVAREVALVAVVAGGDSVAGAEAARTIEPRVLAALPGGPPRGSSGVGGGMSTRDVLREEIDDALVLAQYRLAAGDPAVARRVVPWLRAYVPAPDSAWLGEVAEARALLLDAQVAALERRPDAGAVLARLDSAMRVGYHDVRLTTLGSLVTARLWEGRGEPRRALAALRRRLRGVGAHWYETTWQRELGRLAALTGEREAAIRAYRAYLVRRAQPEPSLAHEVAQVRAALTRLERESAGR